jgi:phospholipase C
VGIFVFTFMFGSDAMKHQVIFGCLTAAFVVATAAALADDFDGGHRDNTRITATPIKHLVVIFQENVSFDHYFGTYPVAKNLAGETPFRAAPGTPKSINTLVTPLDTARNFVPLAGVDLLGNNPNNNPNAPGNGRLNGAAASNPFRLSPAQALTADQGHNESPEESAYDNGRMDGFPAWVGTAGPPPAGIGSAALVMGYYDGNTVTALWNYAQHYALNDNSYTTQFGPSTPGALNLISGQTSGISASINVVNGSLVLLHPTHEAYGDNLQLSSHITVIGDADPVDDVCSNPRGDQVTMAGRNIGDLLNQQNITWGSFMGGFDLTVVNPNGTTGCARETNPAAPGTPAFTSVDYIPHHAWFQYYASTRNPTHARPSSVAAIGHSLIPRTNTPDPANHLYDINDFFAALTAGNLPAVSFLKAPAFQDGHAGYSDPIDEQTFLVTVINALQKSPDWASTAVVVSYDDSDGWYDHQMPPVVNPSFSPVVDTLNGPGLCNHGAQQGRATPATPLNGTFGPAQWGRCGYGTRMPLLVISPFARKNYVDHTLTDQSSILRFIEDNWLSGERIQPGGSFDTIAGTLNNMFDFDRGGDPRRLILDPATGAVIPSDDDLGEPGDHP